ncbi:hypothetical protein ACWEKT_03645 [Nocardia takedensis]
MTEVRVHRAAGVLVIAPAGAPTVLDGAPALGVLVLEVAGGHLSWELTGAQRLPAAVLDDPDAAADWLWALYGEAAALTVADLRPGPVDAEPARPELLSHAWRLAYAHWASRWWPASTIDGIAALDPDLLRADIAELTEACEQLVDGSDAETDPPAVTVAVGSRNDYALAAGGESSGAGLTVARGVGGWDWRRCPPGLLDASERAVSWEVTRETGATLVTVRAAAAPDVRAHVPIPLRPHAFLDSTEIALNLVGDTWIGESPIAAESVTRVEVRVPGVGWAVDGDETRTRRALRDFARRRLDRAADPDAGGFDAPLPAEIAAAATDTDF